MFFGAPRESLVLLTNFLRIISLVLAADVLMLKFIAETIIPLLLFLNELSSVLTSAFLVILSMMPHIEKVKLEYFQNICALLSYYKYKKSHNFTLLLSFPRNYSEDISVREGMPTTKCFQVFPYFCVVKSVSLQPQSNGTV